MKILVLAPHADDAEFGCGGTIARYVEEGNEVFVWVFSLAEKAVPANMPSDSRIEEYGNAMKVLGVKEYWFDNKPEWHRHMEPYRQDILERMVALNRTLSPDRVFIPSTEDMHQDHRVITAEGMRAFKGCSIMGYEMPWNNLATNHRMYVRLTEEQIGKKIEALGKYNTAKHRSYMNPDFIKGLALVRGVQAGSLYAESFEVIKEMV